MADEEWEFLIESADHEAGIITAVPWYFPAAESIKLPADGGIAALLAAVALLSVFAWVTWHPRG